VDSSITKEVAVGWMQTRVLIVCGIYVLLFGAYLLLAFKAVKKKCWKPLVGSIAINTVLLFLILQVGFLWGKTAVTKQTPNEGEYIVSGTNSNNSKYSGKAVISKDGDLYRLKWTIDASPRTPVQEYASVGFIHDGNLCVHFNGAFSGIAVYRISDEQLIGEWVGDSGLNKDGQQKISRGLEVLKRESGLTKKANAGGAQAKEELIKRKAVDDAQRILQEVESRPRIKTDEDNVEKLPFEYYSNELEANATSGDVMAQMKLGQCYRQGNGVGKDYKQAFTWFRKAAEQGDARGECILGACYATGLGVALDEKEAVKWFRKAAEKGDINAQYNLGKCYLKGGGITKDEKEGLKYIKRAAEQNHVEAKMLLQKIINQSNGVDNNFEPYSQELVKRAEGGDAKAQYNLGVCYAKGEGVTQEFKEAVCWWTKAARQDLVLAQHDLGNCYYNGDGVNKDYKEAVKWYAKSAEKGYAASQFNLGNCYFYGTGVDKDEKEAVKWYTKSAEQGNMDAQRNLGLCYYKGTGVEKDEKKAVKLFTQSALSGHPTAQFSLGLCYDTGTGVEKDENAAVRWYTRSAEQGGVNGQNAVAWVLATSNDPAIRNGKEAEKWAQKAIATTGSTNANSLDTLAAAYAEQGNFAAAVSTQERAVSMLTKQDASKSKEFDDHLKSYQAKKPWRDKE